MKTIKLTAQMQQDSTRILEAILNICMLKVDRIEDKLCNGTTKSLQTQAYLEGKQDAYKDILYTVESLQ